MLSGLAVALAGVVLPTAAAATITPTLTLTQSGSAAGSTANVGLDIKFAPSGSDSPKDLTVKLPAGLLANAAINGGACLTTTTLTGPCQVGSGTATASPIVPLVGPVGSLSIPISFYLVPPPQAGDLAGVQVVANFLGTTNLGPPADVTVRPASDPAGVGLNESFSRLPNTFNGLSIAVDELNSTFTGLRLPASCPATPAAVAISGDSYSDPTPRPASAPLQVTACSKLPFAPKFTVTAAEDSGDNGVKVATDITQKANEATSRSVALAFPSAVLAPNAAAVINGGILCADPSFATCKTVGSASSTSPLYPKPLIGKTYLTGSLSAPEITIRFPSPFALTLNGEVDLGTNTTTFSGLPDIPLTDLTVTLAGGANAVFATTCTPPSGTATSTLTSTNADKTVTVAADFTIANCVATPSSGRGGAGGNGGSGGSGKSGRGGKPTGSRPTLTGGSISGLKRARPKVTFTAHAGRNAPKLRSFLIGLPAGLDLVRHRVHHRLRVLGVSLGGARIRSLSVQHGRLFIRLRSPSARITVKIGRQAIRESLRLALRARHRKLHSLTVAAIVRDASGYPSRLTLKIRRLR
ncbi:MAG: hypothetical protein WCB67_00105 [Solirubrobacteraceae bacterium]